MKNDQIEKLYQALNKSSFTVAVTGAGISISAGGISFDQMISSMGPDVLLGGDPDEMYRALYRTFLSAAFDHDPTVAHKALAELILIIGTNGYYGSVYWNYRKRNATIIQINPKRTQFDRVADLNIHQDADTVFGELMPCFANTAEKN